MTKMKQPTQEQIKEFWEWCGFEDSYYSEELVWFLNGKIHKRLPPIDLSNLFKYAVPKLQDEGYMIELYSCECKGYKVSVYRITGQVDIPVVITKDGNPALALFWALWQVKENE